MKRISAFAAVFSFILLCLRSESLGQGGQGFRWRGSGGWGMGTAYQHKYNPATVRFMKGTVEVIEKAVPMEGMEEGAVLIGTPVWAGWQ